MQVRYLLGPAGSGKTFRCLAEIRDALARAPEGLPLLLIAPKQSTYQLERALLEDPALHGFTRLRVLSLERLARFIFSHLGQPMPAMLDEEGRVMVLRGLLARKRGALRLFRASARLTGFASQLSLALTEFQRAQLTPDLLRNLAEVFGENKALAFKLQDFALLLESYQAWLTSHNLLDADSLFTSALAALNPELSNHGPQTFPGPKVEQIWVDGFTEWAPRELELLAALAPLCSRMTISFCLEPAGLRDREQGQRAASGVITHRSSFSWLSVWSVAREVFEDCRRRFESLPCVEATVLDLGRSADTSRFFGRPELAHLERHWAAPAPYGQHSRPRGADFEPPVSPASSPAGVGGADGFLDVSADEDVRTPGDTSADEDVRASGEASPDEEVRTPGEVSADEDVRTPAEAVRLALCADPEGEVRFAAREIRRYVRSGGRYRDVAIFVRNLEDYHGVLQGVLGRYEIPFFLDRRESVAHHPLAELARSALRIVAMGWRHDDLFAALKTGLIHAHEGEIDRLENEALARGWQGAVWEKPVETPGDAELERWLKDFHERVLQPLKHFERRMETLKERPTGAELARALRDLFEELNVEETLTTWATVQPLAGSGVVGALPAVHSTVWEQANLWLENVELAFPNDALSLREWLPVLDAGLANLTVGVIPPALDQVIVGSVDRSRNPEVRIAFVLGLNETVFPAAPPAPVLLTEADRVALEQREVRIGGTARRHLARERFLGYLACSRPREFLILTFAQQDAEGSPLNPSPFVHHVRQLFPDMQVERIPRDPGWKKAEHASELVVPLLKERETLGNDWRNVVTLPPLTVVFEQLRQFRTPEAGDSLSPCLAERLYQRTLRTSVSRIEQFAACPFRFFANSGLRAEERRRFELDAREQGSFQHEVLALFHQELTKEGKRWRDLTVAEAQHRVSLAAEAVALNYGNGLLQANEQTRFLARVLAASLQSFVGTVVEWMHSQYQFDPAQVELPFGEDPEAPAWVVDLGAGHSLALRGRIDRVDLFHDREHNCTYCVVVDYKSSRKQLEDLLMQHGLQLQLLAYLDVLRHWPNPEQTFGVARLVPAGVFYVNLRGKYERADDRGEALANTDESRKLAYRHSGRFSAGILPFLDSRPNQPEGDQFNYRRTQSGGLHGSCREPMPPEKFEALLGSAEANLRKMGERIFSGDVEVAPYRKGSTTACQQCDYQSICRIDPWTHSFRTLRPAPAQK